MNYGSKKTSNTGNLPIEEADREPLPKDSIEQEQKPRTKKEKFLKRLIRWIIGAFLLGIGTITSLYIWQNYWQDKSKHALQAMRDKTVLVKVQDLAVQIQASGIVKAVRTTNISPEEPERVAELYLEEGDRITKGQVIARMNNERLRTEVDRAKASVKDAQANLELVKAGNRPEAIAAAEARVKTARANVALTQNRLKRTQENRQRNQLLVARGAISRNAFNNFVTEEAEAQANLAAELARLTEQQQSLVEVQKGSRPEEVTQAQAQLEQAQAELASNQIRLDKTSVRAPFAGIITRRYAEAGDFVDSTTEASETEGSTSTSIAELSNGLEIEAKIPEASIAKIRLGQKVDIKVDAYSDRNFTGKVRLIPPRAVKEDNVTSFRVKISPIRQAELRTGMNTRLTFFSEPIKDVMTVPLAAVVTQEDGRTGVYISNSEASAKFKFIKLGVVSGNRVEVRKGLKQGDRVLLSPPEDLEIEGVDTVIY